MKSPTFPILFMVLSVDAACADSRYFPPPESQGGWRALVTANQPATDEQKKTVREKAGFDWDRLKAAQDYCASFGTPNNLLVIRHGWIAGEWTNFAGPRGIASCTKSLTALAMAKLFDLSDTGRLPSRVGADDEAWRFLPVEWAEAEPARKAIRIRHLMTMTSGLTPYDGPYKDDYLQQVFAQTVEAPPGKVWAYASVPVDMLSLVIEKVTGCGEEDFFNREINAAIGASPLRWGKFSGHTGGSGGPEGGARFPARELARVGYLVLNDGAWEQDGQRRQVISAARVREITRWVPWLADTTCREPNFAREPNGNQFYGHLWWNNRTGQALGDAVPRDAVFMSGWGKQTCVVVPSLDLVVVRVGAHRKLNDHPEYYRELWKRIMAAVVDGQPKLAPASPQPAKFKGRIAYSADGNHNDPDDWIASPMTLAILAESGLKDRLVHYDYNSILPQTDPQWEKTHADSVLGAVERYGFDRSRFFDDHKDLDGAVASIAKAINDSSADNPLYFIIAGPMEVPYRGIQMSDPARRQFVYCISHSRWNDGFASKYKFTFTKRSVIEQDVHWVQIGDQNRLLSFGRYGRPSPPEEFKPYFWMRDSRDPKVRWLWERMLVSTRPDPSDAGMTWFLATGDEECDPAKLKQLIEDHRPAPPIVARQQVRLEAENFRHLEGFALEDRNDRNASHRLSVKLANTATGRIRTRFDEPFTSDAGRYDVDVRHLRQARFRLLVNGATAGTEWSAPQGDDKWTTHTIAGVVIKRGDELAVEVRADGNATARLDYVQLRRQSAAEPNGASRPPYPPSLVVRSVEFDFSTHRREAPGSDNWPTTWVDDGHLYAAWGDGGGFGGSNEEGRVTLGVARIEGEAANYTGKNVWGGFAPEQPAAFGGKSYGILSVAGTLYMWVVPQPGPHLKECRLAASTDHGRTWSQADWAFRFEDGLTIPTFLNFGRDYAGARDGFVYSYFIQPTWGPATPKAGKFGFEVHKPGLIHLSRAPKETLMKRDAHEFFAGFDAVGNPRWSSRIADKWPVFEDGNGVGWNLSVSHNAGLRRYFLCTEHGATHAGRFGLFDAPEPWGPWTTVAYDETWGAGHVEVSTFYWNFPAKWLSADGTHFTLVFTGKNSNDSWNTVDGRFILHSRFLPRQ